MHNPINETNSVPRFARKIESRPGKEAYNFMKNYKADIWAHYQTSYYYIVMRGKVYRCEYHGMPSALCREDFFWEWLKKTLGADSKK